MEEQGIIEKVSHSDWAAPIVPVPKKDGCFRICGDYKVTVNQVLAVEQYPLPTPEELFAMIAGGKCFSKLDLSQAYLQVQLEEDSRNYVTINTHQGLYRYTRLPFGVASTPALFQKLMDSVLQGIPGIACYIDDILISAKDEMKNMQLLKKCSPGWKVMDSGSSKTSANFSHLLWNTLGTQLTKKAFDLCHTRWRL